MGSSAFTLSKEDLKKIGMGLLIAMAGALATWLAQVTNVIDFGIWAPIVAALAATGVNALRKWIKDNTAVVSILAFCLGMSSVTSHAIDYDCIGGAVTEPAAMYSVTDEINDDAEPRNRQVLFFTARWCGPCQQWKQIQAKRLKEAGWSFGSVDDVCCIIREIDADARPDLVDNYRITSFPTFLCLEDNLIVARFERGVTGSELNSAWEAQDNDESSRSVSDEAVEQVEGRAAGGYRLVDSRAAAGADPGGHARQLRVETTGNRDRKEPEVVSCTVCGSQSCSRVSQGVRVQRYRTGAVRGTTGTVGYVLRTFGCRTGRCP